VWEETGLVMGMLSVLFACYGSRGGAGAGGEDGDGGWGGGGGLWQLNLDYALHDFYLELGTGKTRILQQEWALVDSIGRAKICAM